MGPYPCVLCGEPVKIDVRGLGPWPSRGFLPPVRAICPACAVPLSIHEEDDDTWVYLQGQQFWGFRGGYVRSDEPSVAHCYDDLP